MSSALRTKIDYVDQLGVDVTADLLLAYDNAAGDLQALGDEERVRAGLDAMDRALDAHRARLARRLLE